MAPIRTTMRLSSKKRLTRTQGTRRRERGGLPRWAIALIALAMVWLALMVIASVLSYEHKLPVRIENWKPSPP